METGRNSLSTVPPFQVSNFAPMSLLYKSKLTFVRLPRNHPEVVANLADLAKSISIMPTSGSVFTAQAPLLPVFFLGLLATVEEHVQLADAWFQQVIYTPVRSVSLTHLFAKNASFNSSN